MSPGARGSPARDPFAARGVLRLALPAILSYVLHNTYRIVDQYWVQGLGGEAQAALGAATFVVIMNFAVAYLAIGGALALVARATGAGDRAGRDVLIVQTIVLATALAGVLSALGVPFTPNVVAALGLGPAAAPLAEDYLRVLYAGVLPLVLAPALDTAIVAMGNTVVPLLLQVAAVLLNFALNPVLIYGADAARLDLPLAETAGACARALGVEGWGMGGAALATVLSRAVTTLLALVCLRQLFGVRFPRPRREHLGQLVALARIGLPISLSIGAYAGVYWLLLRLVLTPLGDAPVAGLGIGFQVFEGVSFPCYLGVAISGASLVGRALGAGRPDQALRAVASGRRIAAGFGAAMTLAFWLAAEPVALRFSQDPEVVRATVTYVRVLAASQLFVAFEAVHEKALIGAGHSAPTLWIGATGNLLRLPLAWLLAHRAGAGAAGVWWAITATTALKAGLLTWRIGRRDWLHRPVPGAADRRPPGGSSG